MKLSLQHSTTVPVKALCGGVHSAHLILYCLISELFCLILLIILIRTKRVLIESTVEWNGLSLTGSTDDVLMLKGQCHEIFENFFA